jgi:release factor glutamine methyltransferase
MPSVRPPKVTFYEALKKAKEILSLCPSLVHRGLIETEAEQILLAAFRSETGKDLSRIELFSRLYEVFPAHAFDKIVQHSTERSEGQLLQHLTGRQFFLDHEYLVGPDVLIPRPETEVLVLAAMERLKGPQLGLEVGLGSGIISIELLCHFNDLVMVASELSKEASARALENMQNIFQGNHPQSDRLKVVVAQHAQDVFGPFHLEIQNRKADFIITNPPYLTSEEAEHEVIRHEPHQALFAPPEDPLYFYRILANEADLYLLSGGWVFAEIPHERATEIMNLFAQEKWDPQYTAVLNDLTGRGRVIISKLKG